MGRRDLLVLFERTKRDRLVRSWPPSESLSAEKSMRRSLALRGRVLSALFSRLERIFADIGRLRFLGASSSSTTAYAPRVFVKIPLVRAACTSSGTPCPARGSSSSRRAATRTAHPPARDPRGTSPGFGGAPGAAQPWDPERGDAGGGAPHRRAGVV